MYYKKHPAFKDTAWEVVRAKSYKPGYIDVKFYWVYFDGSRIFQTKSKKRLTLEKWREFVSVRIPHVQDRTES